MKRTKFVRILGFPLLALTLLAGGLTTMTLMAPKAHAASSTVESDQVLDPIHHCYFGILLQEDNPTSPNAVSGGANGGVAASSTSCAYLYNNDIQVLSQVQCYPVTGVTNYTSPVSFSTVGGGSGNVIAPASPWNVCEARYRLKAPAESPNYSAWGDEYAIVWLNPTYNPPSEGVSTFSGPIEMGVTDQF